MSPTLLLVQHLNKVATARPSHASCWEGKFFTLVHVSRGKNEQLVESQSPEFDPLLGQDTHARSFARIEARLGVW